MKLTELFESATDSVARYYKDANPRQDDHYNPEIAKLRKNTQQYYEEYFEDWFQKEITPVFTKPVTKPQKPFSNKPHGNEKQSPGYRGNNYAKARANIPYDKNVQGYVTNPTNLIPNNDFTI